MQNKQKLCVGGRLRWPYCCVCLNVLSGLQQVAVDDVLDAEPANGQWQPRTFELKKGSCVFVLPEGGCCQLDPTPVHAVAATHRPHLRQTMPCILQHLQVAPAAWWEPYVAPLSATFNLAWMGAWAVDSTCALCARPTSAVGAFCCCTADATSADKAAVSEPWMVRINQMWFMGRKGAQQPTVKDDKAVIKWEQQQLQKSRLSVQQFDLEVRLEQS